MKRFITFLSPNKKVIGAVITLIVAGAFFRWEVREVNDAQAGKPIACYRGVVFPWQTCGASGGGKPVNFHVRHWLFYGLVKIEATGTTY